MCIRDSNLPDDEYLERIGAAGFGEDGKLHPTTAGLLMFGEEYQMCIRDRFTTYFRFTCQSPVNRNGGTE